jgi:hypothetical protein
VGRRPNSGDNAKERALGVIATTDDAEMLRAAQATLMPLLGWSLDDTAQFIGRDRWWVSRARNRFLRGQPLPKHGGRRRFLLSEEIELAVVRAAIKEWRFVNGKEWSLRQRVKNILDQRTPTPVSDSTVTELLDRVAPRMFVGMKGKHLVGLADRLAWVWRFGGDWLETRRR